MVFEGSFILYETCIERGFYKRLSYIMVFIGRFVGWMIYKMDCKKDSRFSKNKK